MSNIDFTNLKIIYNAETDYSKRTIRRARLTEVICALACGIVMLVSLCTIALCEDFVPALVFSLLLMVTTCIVIGRILKKVSPPHYEFISWINQYEADEVKIGWFNDRYIALTYTSHHGWKARALEDFLGTKRYKLEDKTKKGQPIKAIIDLTKETAHIKILSNYDN